jgi:membrane protease YdiL (CAAX protease family)
VIEGDHDSEMYFEDEPGDEVEDDGVLFLGGEGLQPVALESCWRCGKQVSTVAVLCPFCRARLLSQAPVEAVNHDHENDDRFQIVERGARSVHAVHKDKPTPMVAILWLYMAIMATSIVWGFISGFGLKKDVVGAGAAESMIMRMSILEAIDSVIVITACLAYRPPKWNWWKGPGRATIAWIGGIILLGALLAINLAFHALLRDILKLPDVKDELFSLQEYRGLLIGLICVQPAIFEELFFRYLTLGHLRSLMGVHGAVFVSGFMFGLAHIGQPLGIPVLILIGVGLGYARVWGGTLLLPMVMHFIHNLVVLYVQKVI